MEAGNPLAIGAMISTTVRSEQKTLTARVRQKGSTRRYVKRGKRKEGRSIPGVHEERWTLTCGRYARRPSRQMFSRDAGTSRRGTEEERILKKS